MKYKAGDRVLVRDDLVLHKSYYMDEGFEYNNFVTEMIPLRGQVVTIKEIMFGQYKIEEPCNGCYWTDEMFVGLADHTEDQGEMDIDCSQLVSFLL